MRVLIVGAGAVGQVYGAVLARGGAEVHVYVRPRHQDEARAGYPLWWLRHGRPPRPERFAPAGVHVAPEELRSLAWDQVWLAVSGPAVGEPWLEEVLAATGDATVVCLQPGPDHRARVGAVAGPRMVLGLITFIAWQSPLPGETGFDGAGVAAWVPPGAAPFEGPPARLDPVLAALRKGGLWARRADVATASTYGGALLQCLVAALDGVGWSWRAVRQGDTLDVAFAAYAEILAAARRDAPPPFWATWPGRWLVAPVMAATRLLLPFDVPLYFGWHFTKVGTQTRGHLDHWIRTAGAAGLSVSALSELRRRLPAEARFDPALVRG